MFLDEVSSVEEQPSCSSFMPILKSLFCSRSSKRRSRGPWMQRAEPPVSQHIINDRTSRSCNTRTRSNFYELFSDPAVETQNEGNNKPSLPRRCNSLIAPNRVGRITLISRRPFQRPEYDIPASTASPAPVVPSGLSEKRSWIHDILMRRTSVSKKKKKPAVLRRWHSDDALKSRSRLSFFERHFHRRPRTAVNPTPRVFLDPSIPMRDQGFETQSLSSNATSLTPDVTWVEHGLLRSSGDGVSRYLPSDPEALGRWNDQSAVDVCLSKLEAMLRHPSTAMEEPSTDSMLDEPLQDVESIPLPSRRASEYDHREDIFDKTWSLDDLSLPPAMEDHRTIFREQLELPSSPSLGAEPDIDDAYDDYGYGGCQAAGKSHPFHKASCSEAGYAHDDFDLRSLSLPVVEDPEMLCHKRLEHFPTIYLRTWLENTDDCDFDQYRSAESPYSLSEPLSYLKPGYAISASDLPSHSVSPPLDHRIGIRDSKCEDVIGLTKSSPYSSVHECWDDDDFDFGDGLDEEIEQKSQGETQHTHQELSKFQDTNTLLRGTVTIPQAIIEQQESVHGSYGLVQKFMKLVKELERLVEWEEATCSSQTFSTREIWNEAKGIISLAKDNDQSTPDCNEAEFANDLVVSLPASPPFSSPMSPKAPLSAASSQPRSRTSSFDSVEAAFAPVWSPSFNTSPSTPNTFLDELRPMHHSGFNLNRNDGWFPQLFDKDDADCYRSADVHQKQERKFLFDTQCLKALVTRASKVAQSLHEVVCRIEGDSANVYPPFLISRKSALSRPRLSELFDV